MKMQRGISPMEFLMQVVLPALFDRLDEAFPEFGWERTGRGWTATDVNYAKEKFGTKPRQVEANFPIGFMIDGKRFMSWPAYLNDGAAPSGRQFVQIVHRLAAVSGIDDSLIDDQPTAEEEQERRRVNLLETFMAQSQSAMWSGRGKTAKTYLIEQRGFYKIELKDPFFGFYTTTDTVKKGLMAAGFTSEEIVGSGLLADQRWENRLVFPWRDRWGRIQTIAARDVTRSAEEGTEFLYLSGGDKPPAFGLHRALRSGEGQWDLVLVQGLIDVVYFHCRGFPNVAAIGGHGQLLTAQRWEAFNDYGVRCVTLALDSDQTGRQGIISALDHLREVEKPPIVFVLSPDDLGSNHDPGQLVRQHGTMDEFRRILDRRKSAAVYRGLACLKDITPASADHQRRMAIERLLDYLVPLNGPTAELDREDLVDLAAQHTGYSRYALRHMLRERGLG